LLEPILTERDIRRQEQEQEAGAGGRSRRQEQEADGRSRRRRQAVGRMQKAAVSTRTKN
jgi:hypothetical protein